MCVVIKRPFGGFIASKGFCMKDDLVVVTLRGNTMSHRRDSIKTKSTMPRPEMKKAVKLKKKVDRSHNEFRRNVYSIKGSFQAFISLIFPNRIVDADDVKTKKAFWKKFLDKINYRYDDFHCIYKMEWAQIAGLHYHILCNFYYDNEEFNIKIVRKIVRDIWAEVLGLKNSKLRKKSASIEPFGECHIYYLCKKDKVKQDMRCMDIINGCNAYGFIKKKKFEFYEVKSLEMTLKEYSQFISLAYDYLEKKCRDTSSLKNSLVEPVAWLVEFHIKLF